MDPRLGPAPMLEGGAHIITLEGAVTGAACPGLRDAVLRRLPDGINQVLIDASAVTAIDDAVFAVLLAGGAWLRTRGGRIGFSAASASVRRSLAALGLSTLLPVLGERAAVAPLHSPGVPESHALHDLQAVVPRPDLPLQRATDETPVTLLR